MLHPRKLVPGFQFLRHALGGFHLLHDKGKPFLRLFVHISKVRPEFPG